MRTRGGPIDTGTVVRTTVDIAALAPPAPDFRALFESVPALLLALAPDAPRYTIVGVSDAYARATMTRRDELVGHGLFEAFPDDPDDPSATGMHDLRASLDRVVAEHAPQATAAQRHDVRRPAEEGGGFEERWWSSVSSPVFDARGELVNVLHRVEDVTELVRPREAGSDTPLVLVVEGDEEMRRCLCEALAAEHRVASARDGREGLDLAISLRPDLIVTDTTMPGTAGDALVRGARTVRELDRTPIVVLSARGDDPDGVRILREGAQDYLTKPFAIEELCARVDNLLAGRRARESEARLASLVEQASDGIFVADLDGRYVQVNEAGCRMLGYAREEILGKSIVDLIPPEDVPRLAESKRAMLEGRTHLAEWTLLRKDGTPLPVEVSARISADGRWQGFVRDISERRRAEEAPRRVKSDLERAQSVAQIGSWRLDVARDELVWSKETYRIFGVPEGTPMTYDAFVALVDPEDRARVEEHWRAALAGAPYDIEHRIRVDGEVRWVRERAELVVDAQKRAVGGIGTSQDVTDRKRAELAIRAAEQSASASAARVRALSDAAAAITQALAGLTSGDITTMMEVVATHARTLADAEYAAFGLGSDPERPFAPWVQIGMTAEVATRIGRAPRPIGVLGAVARSDRVVRVADVRSLPEFGGLPPEHPPLRAFLGVPVRLRGESVGNVYLANKRGGPEFTADDQGIVEALAARAATAFEIADLYQSEAETRAWMQAVVDQMPDGALLLDADGHVTAQNRALRALAAPPGGDAHDPFGNPLLVQLSLPSGDPISPADLPYVAAISRGEACIDRELDLRRADGTVVPVLVSTNPVWTADGTRAGAVMIVRDVSAQRELERLREEWTSVVAHDLRQPVNVIALAAGSLDRLSLSEESRARSLASIRKAARSLARMIDDLLDASLIEARRMTLDRRAISLPALAREVVERLPDVAARCDLAVSTPGADRAVLADAGRIEQVLSNLLLNAVKYGEAGTPIRLELAPRSANVEVVVSNRGPGIAREELPRLFRRFERVHGVRSGRKPGIGLGLYLSRGLVEAHGGRIWAESTPGETTSFHFTIPYASLDDEAARDP